MAQPLTIRVKFNNVGKIAAGLEQASGIVIDADNKLQGTNSIHLTTPKGSGVVATLDAEQVWDVTFTPSKNQTVSPGA